MGHRSPSRWTCMGIPFLGAIGRWSIGSTSQSPHTEEDPTPLRNQRGKAIREDPVTSLNVVRPAGIEPATYGFEGA
jgi:hypothetical protein